MQQPLIVFLSDPVTLDPELSGSAASDLAALHQAGLPVPEGFVVTTAVFRTAPHGEVTPDVEAALARAVAQLASSSFVVRPSLAAAAHLEATLPVVRGVTAATLPRQIEQAWQTLASSGMQQQAAAAQINLAALELAVLVQPEVPATAFGTAGAADVEQLHGPALSSDEQFSLQQLVGLALRELGTSRRLGWVLSSTGFWLINSVWSGA